MISPKSQQIIDERTDDVIDRAQKLIDGTKVYEKKKMAPTQLKNLVEMACSTDSVKALEVFVRYQMARRNEWKFNNFGDRLLSEEFSWLLNLAKEISKNSGDDPKKVHLELIKLFLGYANRYFVYKKESYMVTQGGRES